MEAIFFVLARWQNMAKFMANIILNLADLTHTKGKEFDYQNGCHIDLVSKECPKSIVQVYFSPFNRLQVI